MVLTRLLLNFSMSGRDIRDVCQQAERRWASKVSSSNHDSIPLYTDYNTLFALVPSDSRGGESID